MKTIVSQKNSRTQALKTLIILFMFGIFSNSLGAQTEAVEVKGIINSKIGPLDGVNIYLKNSSVGTVSKSNGSFAFPQKLNVGDIIIFSYLGYVKQSIVVSKASSSLEVFMEEAPIDVLSAPNSNIPYRSKRSHRRQ